jgi:hypothetical protein|tara:strand:- start:526 stop:1320 length:795 start_codon:yes stop_codon:yes gene_type:complete
MRDGKDINTNSPEENKKTELRAVGAKITAQRLVAEKVVEEIKHERKKEKDTPKRKEKSTKILLRTQTILKKASAAWPARNDLRVILQEINEVVVADDFKRHTKTFVKVLSVLEEIIPLWTGEQMLQLTKLQKLIRLLNKNEREYNFEKSGSIKIKSHLTTGDISRWLQTSKKGDRLVYYTGHTFDHKEYQQQKVFDYVRDLCFDFAPIASAKKFYSSKGASGSDWGVKYHNIITLFQQVVAPEQKDNDKNIITHKVYNYIMEKL